MAIQPQQLKNLFSAITRKRSGLISVTLGLLGLALIVPVAISIQKDSFKQPAKSSSPQIIIAHKIPSKVTVSVPSASSDQTKPTTASSSATSTTEATPTKSTPDPAPVVVPSPSSSVSNLTPTTTPAPSGSATSSGSSSNSDTSSSAPIQNYDSTNWSGYMATTTSYTSISASWAAPRPTSSAHQLEADATWIGIGGVTTSDLIQVGTENTVESNGQVDTAAFYEMLPAASQTISQITVSPGDSISASVVQVTPGQWTISITDLTDNQTYSTAVAYNSTNSSAEWIEEDPSLTSGRLIPLDDFGTANFTGGQTIADGSTDNIAEASPDSITMVNREDQTEALPSALNGSGNGFSVSWQNP
jgi:Peptidase A4 family